MKAITVRLTDQQGARVEEIAALCRLAPESLSAVLLLSNLAASDHEPDKFVGTLFGEAAHFITKGSVPGNGIARFLNEERARRRGESCTLSPR